MAEPEPQSSSRLSKHETRKAQSAGMIKQHSGTSEGGETMQTKKTAANETPKTWWKSVFSFCIWTKGNEKEGIDRL